MRAWFGAHAKTVTQERHRSLSDARPQTKHSDEITLKTDLKQVFSAVRTRSLPPEGGEGELGEVSGQ